MYGPSLVTAPFMFWLQQQVGASGIHSPAEAVPCAGVPAGMAMLPHSTASHQHVCLGARAFAREPARYAVHTWAGPFLWAAGGEGESF